MKLSLILISAILVAFVLIPPTNSPVFTTVAARAKDSAPHAPVLIELFTSEGCFSCPPADDLLARLEEQQPVAGVEIVALEEHVDYWNQLGWVDPFSSEQWTERQQAYAASRNSESVYTPQIVVNGRSELVGGRSHDVVQTIAASVSQLQTEVSLAPLPYEKRDRVQFKVSVGKVAGAASADTAEVWIGISEKGLHSSVSRGENAGHDLHHASVLRLLRKLGTADKNSTPSFTAQPELKLDSSWNHSNLRAIAFLQEKRSRHMLGAVSLVLTP